MAENSIRLNRNITEIPFRQLFTRTTLELWAKNATRTLTRIMRLNKASIMFCNVLIRFSTVQNFLGNALSCVATATILFGIIAHYRR